MATGKEENLSKTEQKNMKFKSMGQKLSLDHNLCVPPPLLDSHRMLSLTFFTPLPSPNKP